MSGRFEPGARLETEVRMAERYDVSVVPVRQALRALIQEGLVTRQRGSGTFVSDRIRTREGSTSLELLYSREFQRPAEVIDRGEEPTPVRFATSFPGESDIGYARRLAYRDDRPWSYGVLYFPLEFADRITTPLLQRWPMYRIMQEQCGVHVVRSRFDAQAIGASADVASRLGVDPLSPILSLTCVSFDHNDRPIGAFEMNFPSAPFTFSFETLHDFS